MSLYYQKVYTATYISTHTSLLLMLPNAIQSITLLLYTYSNSFSQKLLESNRGSSMLPWALDLMSRFLTQSRIQLIQIDLRSLVNWVTKMHSLAKILRDKQQLSLMFMYMIHAHFWLVLQHHTL